MLSRTELLRRFGGRGIINAAGECLESREDLSLEPNTSRRVRLAGVTGAETQMKGEFIADSAAGKFEKYPRLQCNLQ